MKIVRCRSGVAFWGLIHQNLLEGEGGGGNIFQHKSNDGRGKRHRLAQINGYTGVTERDEAPIFIRAPAAGASPSVRALHI